MRKTTIRLSDRLWQLIQQEAESEGITAAQYIREAVIARIFYDHGLRGGRPYEALARKGDDGSGDLAHESLEVE